MLYLLDANVLIAAKDSYYPVDTVPEFWDWLEHMSTSGHVKMPLEIFEEIKDGPADKERDLLYGWIQQPHIRESLVLKETVQEQLVQRVVERGYAPDLTDDEVEELGRDPFLIAYALASPADRCVVTAEASKPSLRRQNRRVPDVCQLLTVPWCGPFDLNRRLGFRTSWRAR